MRLTRKLLSALNRVFSRDPLKFLALRLSYEGTMSWRVEDAVLHTTVDGGVGSALEVDLSDYTVASLALFLHAQPGYDVLYVDGTDAAQLSARVLLDGGSDITASNGDHLYGYTSVLFAFFESLAGELDALRLSIGEALKQLSTRTASDAWLDELGGYYGIPRIAGEPDESYGPRIIAEVLRPRGNNVALEMAIKTFTGQDATVTDVEFTAGGTNFYDGTYTHNAAINHSDTAAVNQYGLFDVEYGYDLINAPGDFSEFATIVRGVINRLRDAGTHLRALDLVGTGLDDSSPAPTDAMGDIAVAAALADEPAAPTEETTSAVSMVALTDTMAAPTEEADLEITYGHFYNGGRSYNGAITHTGGIAVSETL
jgi:hypothetical protein